MNTPGIIAVASFIKVATKKMLARPDSDCTSYFALTDRVAIVVAWEPGYDPEDAKTNKYILPDGWGIAWSLRLRDSSYFINDWDYLGEMGRSAIDVCDGDDDFIALAKEILDIAQKCGYLNPEVVITLPNNRKVDLLDDAYWVSMDDGLRNEKRDLTELWWYYHGWSHWIGEKQELQATMRKWAEHLADYYGDYEEEGFQQLIGHDELVVMIFQALIKEED